MKAGGAALAVLGALFAATLFGFIYPSSPLGFLRNWLILLLLMVGATIAAFVWEYERRELGSKEVSLVAMLGGLSAATRIPFAAVPSFHPCTFLIICAGYTFGALSGFMVGATTALVSNFFLGHGPWTPFQIFAWGGIGALSSLLGRYRVGELGLVIWGGIAGLLYGWTMNLWFWVAFIEPLNLASFMLTYIQSAPFDAVHAMGNMLLLSLFGNRTLKILDRFKKRFHVEFLSDVRKRLLDDGAVG